MTSSFYRYFRNAPMKRRLPKVGIKIAAIFLIGIVTTKLKTLFFVSHLDLDINNVNVSNYRVNDTWTDIRKNLLSRQQISKVVILALARGGSTLCSDIFNIENDSTILWYEPLKGFLSYYYGLPKSTRVTALLYHRNLTRNTFSSHKVEALTEFLTDLLTCNIKSLPIEFLSRISFKSVATGSIVECMEQHNVSSRRQQCETTLFPFNCSINDRSESPVPEDESLASLATCHTILRTLRIWKPENTPNNTIDELLQRYLDEPYSVEFRQIFHSSCGNVFPTTPDSRRLPTTVFADERVFLNERLHPRCRNVRRKFSAIVERDKCLTDLANFTSSCLEVLESRCEQMRLTVAEVQRMFLADLEPLIRQMPDVHVVHYVRDPRAVSSSRMVKRSHTFIHSAAWTIVDEAMLLCKKMRYDMQERKRLERIYPDSVIVIRYEDLVLNPVKTISMMYEYFGSLVPRELQKWATERFKASEDNGRYGVNRKNGKEHLTEWRSRVDEAKTKLINGYCIDVLNEYNYDL